MIWQIIKLCYMVCLLDDYYKFCMYYLISLMSTIDEGTNQIASRDVFNTSITHNLALRIHKALYFAG